MFFYRVFCSYIIQIIYIYIFLNPKIVIFFWLLTDVLILKGSSDAHFPQVDIIL